MSKEILKVLIDNAEEPDDIKDGVGTFTTYRVEYVINELDELLAKREKELLDKIEDMLLNDKDSDVMSVIKTARLMEKLRLELSNE